MKPSVKYGLYYFVISALFTLLLYYVKRDLLFNTTISLLTGIGFAILFIVLAIREERNNEDGFSMAEGIKTGMITFGIGSLLGAIFTFILYNYIDPTLIDDVIEFSKNVAIKTAETMANVTGMDEAQKADIIAEVNKQEIPNPMTFSKTILGWVIGLIFPGLIISAIAGAIMKRSNG